MDGTITPGICDPVKLAPIYHLDKLVFQDKHVLDVGAWNGGWSFYAESRGAAMVTAVDRVLCRPGSTAAFDMIRQDIGSKTVYKEVNAYNLWHAFPPKSFDIVLCFGILYHLSDPAFALMNCVHAARETIVVETVAKQADEAVTLPQLTKGRCRVAMRFEPIVGVELPTQWNWTVFPHPLAN